MQVFKFPGIVFRPNGDESHHEIYGATSVRAHVTSNLLNYFVNSVASENYDISPGLRHAVSETNEKIKLQENGREVAYLVIEESIQSPQ